MVQQLNESRKDCLQEYDENKAGLEVSEEDEEVEKVQCLDMIRVNDDVKCDRYDFVEVEYSYEGS
jgi:dTDP-4-amino-4,6-dideoxygalactose transaminase